MLLVLIWILAELAPSAATSAGSPVLAWIKPGAQEHVLEQRGELLGLHRLGRASATNRGVNLPLHVRSGTGRQPE